MGAVEATFEEIPNIFDTGGAKGLPGDSVEKIPKILITNDNNVDASGERVSCSVCLQVTESNSFILYLFFYLICHDHHGVYTISKCRTFRLVKQLEVYLSAITCFTYLASIHGWWDTDLVLYAEGISNYALFSSVNYNSLLLVGFSVWSSHKKTSSSHTIFFPLFHYKHPHVIRTTATTMCSLVSSDVTWWWWSPFCTKILIYDRDCLYILSPLLLC